MSNSILIQYLILAVVFIVIAIGLFRYFTKIKQCNSPEDACNCCSAKSLCKKSKKSNKDIVEFKK